MSSLRENIYDIKDLYIVKLNNEYVEKKGDYIQYYNRDLKFIVEKFSMEKIGELPYYSEIYTECITEQDLYSRHSSKPFRRMPKVFSSLEEFPKEYLTEEELKTEKVSTMRLFQIFQEINVKEKVLTK